MALTLQHITRLLESDKVKERQEGIKALDETFAQPEKVAKVDSKGWQIMFAAVFVTFDKEKQAATKKGTLSTLPTSGPGAIATSRLREVSKALRTLVGRSVKKLGKRATSSVLEHLFANVKYHGGLFEPVAHDYLRAIEQILRWKPHLDHLDSQTLVRLLELCFNVLLEDSFKTRLEDEPQDEVREPSPSEGGSGDEGAESDEDVEMTGSPGKKRRRGGSHVPPPRTPTHVSRREEGEKAVTHEKAVAADILLILLQSPSCPLQSLDYPFLPAAVLNRFQRLLQAYPKGTLHPAILAALSTVLSHCILNKSQVVALFARNTWSAITRLWRRQKDIRETVVVIIRMLLPFLSLSDERISEAELGGELMKLWTPWTKEIREDKKVDSLSLECLRLDIRDGTTTGTFIANSFRFGWEFGTGQALAWAMLELRADCAAKLYSLSECMQAVDTSVGKRVKLEDPVSELLWTIQKQTEVTLRTYRLQCLLFLIDRHWHIFHSTLKESITSTLMQFLSYDDASIQSWTFLCLAGIAHACAAGDGPESRHLSSSSGSGPWDAVWTHAMRRSNVPRVCRAACHVAHTLLFHAKTLLSPNKVLNEIETLAKDLNIQGPSFPYDSVCSFLGLCMRVASQDVRLYRMQLEEKVLTWLIDSWRPTKVWDKLTMPPHSVQDVLGLLGVVCGVPRQVEVMCEMVLPDCSIVEAMLEEHSTAVIRDFVLYAGLPPFRPGSPSGESSAPSSAVPSFANDFSEGYELASPGGKERRLSAFLVKYLDEFVQEWEADRTLSKLTVERIRVTLDFTITALCFESLLSMNGTRSNRRVVQAACKLICSYMVVVTERRWTWNERLFILASLDPLLLSEPRESDVEPWEMFLPPGQDTGIRQDVLHRLTDGTETSVRRADKTRREFLQVLFHNSDVQDALPGLLDILRNSLRMVGTSVIPQRMELMNQTKDGFEFRVSNETKNNFDQDTKAPAVLSRVVRTCIGSLANFPLLQSSNSEPTRDQDLLELVHDSSDEAFLFLTSAYLQYVRRRALHMTSVNLVDLLKKVGKLARAYSYSSWEGLRLLAMSTLRSTIHIWTESSDKGLSGKVEDLCFWLIEILENRPMLSWRAADSMVSFLDDYLRVEPSQKSWSSDSDMKRPHMILHELVDDVDIRVRLRAAVASARSFDIIQTLQVEAKDWYAFIRGHLCKNIDDTEGILSRLICLGNIVLVNSSVRRGAYWHFLELCFHSSAFNHHIDAVHRTVAERMGLTIASLFGAYSAQIAFSIRQTADYDFLKLPHHLLGYQDMKDCAQAAFQAFSATNLLSSGDKSTPELHGRTLFKNHCRILKKSIDEGLRDNLAEIVGQQIAYWMDSNCDFPETNLQDLEAHLAALVGELGHDVPFTQHLRPCADGIITSIIRTVGDQDYSESGPMIKSLKDVAGASTETFVALTKFRTGISHTHEAILPAYQSTSVLKALNWLDTLTPHADDVAITYHVLHHLFADLERNPLVNEQLRLLNVICLWVSCRHEHFSNHTITKTFLNGAMNILAQTDLALGAQSMLDWAFTEFKNARSNPDTFLGMRLTEILLRISCIAYDYTTQPVLEVSLMGGKILDWVEVQAARLHRTRAWRSQVVRALSAWPRELDETLQGICRKGAPEELSLFLQDTRISTNKFRVVRHLQEVAAGGMYDDSQFAKSDFWRLKACIPSEDRMLMDDVYSFAELLLLSKGRIDGIENRHIAARTTRSLHIRNFGDEVKRTMAARQAILVSLLAILEEPSAAQAHLAFLTLRSLASVASTDPTGSSAWPMEYSEELTLLKAYSSQIDSIALPDLGEALSQGDAMEGDKGFSSWVTFFATVLCRILSSIELFYAPLITMMHEDPTFAEELLPVLIQAILQHERSANAQTRSYTFRQVISQYFTRLLSSDATSVSCHRVIVDTILHLRHFPPIDMDDPLGYDKWLEIDFTLLSQSATSCGAYTTALLFTELAAEHTADPVTNSVAVEQVLYEIYTHIDEPDGFYGIKTEDLYGFVLKRLHHENQWQKAFQFHGAALGTSTPDGVHVEGILRSLHAFGFNHLAMNTLQNLPGLDDSFNLGSMTYDLGWRTETWDLPVRSSDCTGMSIYLALRAVHRERDRIAVEMTVRRSLVEEMGRLRSLGEEDTTEIRQVARNLLCLNEIRLWQRKEFQDKFREKQLDHPVVSVLSQIDQGIEYPLLEALATTRMSLLHSLRYKEEREQVGTIRMPFTQSLVDVETKCLVGLSQASRKAGNIQVALNSIIRAQQLCSTDRFDVSQEFAHALWHSKEPRAALLFLETLVAKVDSNAILTEASDDAIEKAKLYALLGTWASEAFLEKPDIIKSRYFDTAISQADNTGPASATNPLLKRAHIYHQYASFAEHQYNAVMKSPDAIRLKAFAQRKRDELKKRTEVLSKYQTNTPEYKTAWSERDKADRLLKLDESQINEQNKARDVFLEQAIVMYSYALSSSDEFDDDCAIRLCSLWFSNFDHPDEHLQESVGSALHRVPSRKFVFLSHQLSARLSKGEIVSRKGGNKQQENLQEVIIRMCREHPYHSLYPVYCLRSDQSHTSSTRRQSSRQDPIGSQTARLAAAMEVFNRLEKDPSCKDRVEAVKQVCDASLEWAKYPIKGISRDKSAKVFRTPSNMRILKLKHMKVPVLTAHTSVDVTTRYTECVWIESFEDTYETAGGMNLPKITQCVGSDGKKYKQLYKGEGSDDLRQDAVMEQVFDLVNVVLRHDRETTRRNLGVRGYKVIPLASQAGVIEFVGNTRPLNNWISKAHTQYQPNDIPPSEFAHQMQAARPKGHRLLNEREQAHLTALFIKLRKRFKPVMRHFFTELHKDPKSWFRMRLSYARSAAVTSIVGHVLGLGDRHLSNILIDTQSGEVVHIDLGIAFEQGQILPVPERVPFRLTADMVDGLGTTGVEGVFRKCAEETLRVLQNEAEVIVTVLEVFKYDPLHSWTASEMRIKRAQSAYHETASELAVEAFKFTVGLELSAGTADEAAERALNSVTRKLDKGLNVMETVQTLISDATNDANLANMYIGWAPHL